MKQTTVILLLLLSVSAYSETVENLIAEALRNNPKIRAVRRESEAAQEQIKAKRKIPDLVISGGYFINEVETRVGPQKAKIGVSQVIPLPGKIKAFQSEAQAKYDVTIHTIATVESDIAASVRKAWDQLWLIGEQLTLNEQSDKLLAHQQEVLYSQYATGSVPQSALLRIEVSRAKLQDEILTLKSDAVRLREALRTLLNRKHFPETFLPTKLSALSRVESIDDSVIVAESPLLQGAQQQSVAAERNVTVSKKAFTPTLMVMTDYIFTDETENDMVKPEENGKDPWIVGASISVPIWAKSRNAEIKSAESKSMARREQVESVQLQLESKLVALREMISDAERRIALYSETVIPRAEQTLRLIEEEYRQNSASVLEYLDAQQTLLDLELLLLKQQVRRNIARADIYNIAGWTSKPIGGDHE